MWVIIDSKVFDLSKFVNLHPGGASVLLDEDVAGKDVRPTTLSLSLALTNHNHFTLRTNFDPGHRRVFRSSQTRSPPDPTLCAPTDRHSPRPKRTHLRTQTRRHLPSPLRRTKLALPGLSQSLLYRESSTASTMVEKDLGRTYYSRGTIEGGGWSVPFAEDG